MSKECPCHYCTKRKNGCHDTCPEYKAWCWEKKEWNDFIRRKRHEESLVTDHNSKDQER